MPAEKTSFKFKWGNFLQGGLLLYLLGLFLVYERIQSPQIGWATYFSVAFAILLWVMATGLTFGGSVFALLGRKFNRSGKPARQKPMTTVTVSGNRYMANEQVKSMPGELRATLLEMLHQNMTFEAIEYYRHQTKADPRLAADVITQLQEFERRGLLE